MLLPPPSARQRHTDAARPSIGLNSRRSLPALHPDQAARPPIKPRTSTVFKLETAAVRWRRAIGSKQCGALRPGTIQERQVFGSHRLGEQLRAAGSTAGVAA